MSGKGAVYYGVGQKNQTTLKRYNFDVHERILTIFGRNVSEKVRNQMMLYFPTSPN